MPRTTVSSSDLGLEVPQRLTGTTPENMRITATTDALDLFRVAAILVVLASAVTTVWRNRRPVARRSLLWPIVTAGLMMGGLTVGAMYSLYEFALRDKAFGGWFWWAAIGSGVVIWCVWAVLFYRSSHAVEPSDLISRQCRLMLRGSILELLVAVPTHIVARSRDYCCAGAMTFVGLTLGISVMLFSFGPAVFFLYVERWRRLHPEPVGESAE